MKASFKIMTKKSRLALIAATAVVGVASPAFAQSYSFPTYAYTHPGAGLGSAAHAPDRKAGLYNAAPIANIQWAVDPNAWGSTTGRQNSR
jgi:hypothetical protein